jgi:hypothetical protein
MIGLALVGGHPALSLSFLALAVAMRLFDHVCVQCKWFFFSSHSALHACSQRCMHPYTSPPDRHRSRGASPGHRCQDVVFTLSRACECVLLCVARARSVRKCWRSNGCKCMRSLDRSGHSAYEHANFGGATACPHLDEATERRRGKRHINGDADVHLATEIIFSTRADAHV